MPSGSLHRPHRPRRSGRTGLRLLATLIVALALAEPAAAESFGAEEVQEMNSMMAQDGVQMPPEVTVPEVPMDASVPVEAVPVEVPPVEPAPAEAAPPPPAPATVEPDPAPSPEPAPAEPAEPPAVETAPPAVPAEPPEPSAKPPDRPAPPPAPLGAGDTEPVDIDPEALLEQVTEPPPTHEEVSAEPPSALSDMADPDLPEEIEQIVPVVPVNLNVDIRIFSPGDDGDVNQFVDIPGMPTGGSGAPGALDGSNGLDLGLDWTWNWTWVWQCGGAATAGMNWNWNWTWDDACLPQDLGSELLGDRPIEGRLDGLLEALAPEGTNLAEAVDRIDDPFDPKPPAKKARDDRPQAHATKPSKSHHGGAVPVTSPGPPPPSFGDGALPALALSPSSGAEGDQARAAVPAGGAAGPEPARDPADDPPQSLALAGLAPSGGGGGGGGGGLFFILAAVLGALALVPLLAGGRVQTLHRKLSSLLSSSRLERPG
jgi:hypothetical protein